MNYKEPSFELDERQISFKSRITRNLILSTSFTCIIMWLISSHRMYSLLVFYFIGGAISILTLRFLLRTKVLLTDISYIEIKAVKDQDGEFSFNGTGSFKTFFPSGLDKFKTENVFLIHQKAKKIIIGYAPNNCDETIAALKHLNINVMEGSAQ